MFMLSPLLSPISTLFPYTTLFRSSSSLLSFAMVAFLPVGGTRSLLCAARSRLVVRSGAPGRGGRRTALWLWDCCWRPEGEAHRLGPIRPFRRPALPAGLHCSVSSWLAAP